MIMLFRLLLLCPGFVLILKERKNLLTISGLFLLKLTQIFILFYANKETKSFLNADVMIATIPIVWVFCNEEKSTRKYFLWLFMLSIALFLIRSVGLIGNIAEIIFYTNFIGISTLILVRCICCFRLYTAKTSFDNNKPITDWVKYLLLFSILECMVKFLVFFEIGIIKLPPGFGDDIFQFLMSFISLLLLAKLMNAIYSNQVTPSTLEDEPVIDYPDAASSYQSSKLNQDDIEFITSEVMAYLDKTNKYLDSNFTLEKLSELTAIPKHHISQAINTEIKKNFYGLISDYRIKHAKKLLSELSHIKVETLAYSCGFNSVSSFYKNFKKLNGMTPAEYIAMQNKKLNKQAIVE